MGKKIVKFLESCLDWLPLFLFGCSIIIFLFSIYSSIFKGHDVCKEEGQFAFGFIMGFLINIRKYV